MGFNKRLIRSRYQFNAGNQDQNHHAPSQEIRSTDDKGDERTLQTKPKYISTEEACNYLQVSSRTLQRMRDNGQIKFYQFGRNIRYTYADLDAFMQGNAFEPFNQQKGGLRYV